MNPPTQPLCHYLELWNETPKTDGIDQQLELQFPQVSQEESKGLLSMSLRSLFYLAYKIQEEILIG